jgi:DNA-binding NarL/FixJ family response regulator
VTVDLGADGLTVTEFRPRLKKAPTASPDPAARRRAAVALVDAFPDQALEAMVGVIASAARLSPLETRVFAFAMDGLQGPEIAAVLEKAPGTIHSVRARIAKKLIPLREEVLRSGPSSDFVTRPTPSSRGPSRPATEDQ